MHIGIIGGGLSAYLLAYRLRGYGHTLEIFEESSNVGGNCHTTDVSVGACQRWADLAVNDFNAPMYRDVVDIMDYLGISYSVLEDTASFYSTDGTTQYTLDGGWGTGAPEKFEHLYAVFAARAYDVMRSPEYASTTVAQFLANEAPFASNPDFAHQCILPRVNAMYFCSPDGPGAMPIQIAYLYYFFQEGFGTDSYATPNGPAPMVNRQYFINGARSFVDAIRADARKAGAVIRSGGPATAVPGDQAMIGQDGQGYGPYDAVVMTCHADQALTALGSYGDPDVMGMLKSVTYAPSTAVVHQDQTLLPPPEFRRTYNVLVRGPGEHTAYSMTYVINQHQADRENVAVDYYNCGEFYVSLNPVRQPQNILTDPTTGQPAVYSFPHNVGDVGLQQAQATVWRSTNAIQGRNKLWFIGGWTTGAGLMIECWNAVQSLVALWNGEAPHAAFDATRAPEHYAPTYIRKLRPAAAPAKLNRNKVTAR